MTSAGHSNSSDAPGSPVSGSTKDSANDADWTSNLVDRLDGAVGTIRDRAVVPVTTVARAIVYGFLGVILGVAAAVLFTALIVRVISILVESHLNAGVWLTYLITGILFLVAGLFAWSKRSPAKQRQ